MTVRAIERAGLRPGEDVAISLDVAASEFGREGRYRLARESRDLDSEAMIALLLDWIGRYPIVSIEDPLAEDDEARDDEGRVSPTLAHVEAAAQQRVLGYDRAGDGHFDTVSAFIKSLRGNDPDAALYWMLRMLDGGADPRYVGRRVVRMASEDVGLADPRALGLTLDACEAYERLGSPEGELALAQAVLYLACAPKSNAAYSAYNAARAFVANDSSRPVPMHLRNAPTRLMKELGYGAAYRYAHDEEGRIADQAHLPEEIAGTRFYEPADAGAEAEIARRMREWEHLIATRRRSEPGAGG